MKKILYKSFTILCFSIFIFSQTNAQGVGINATGAAPNADAMLHVDAATTNKGLLVTGTFGGSVPDLGAGSRLMFYPGKSAFRAGNVTGTQWDNSNVGSYSVAMGNNTVASGSNAIALGTATIANGTNATALGSNTIASGITSTAMGNVTNATGNNSTAMGNVTNASGISATAMGNVTTASGDVATAMGNGTVASGQYSTAMGDRTFAGGALSTALGDRTSASGAVSFAMGSFTTASGNRSTALGHFVSTNNKTGAFIISDAIGTGSMSNADNEMTMGFSGGYRLFSNSSASTGVMLPANGNAWVSFSDINRKENLEPLDGEDVLQKISKIKFTSWNYKQQDPKIYRHYGIMAQDFYNAFGHDKHGSIGNDSTVNPIDMIGIDMAAIKALEKRTTELKKELAISKEQNETLNKKMATIDEVKKENEVLKQSIAQMQAHLSEQQKLIAQTLNELKSLAVKQAETESISKK